MTNLDGVVMFVSGTASNGVVDRQTQLRFSQRGDRVVARYAGGHIERGCLAGRWKDGRLTFRYAQRESDGVIHRGSSVCDVLEHEGRTRIVEHFTWTTRAGSGVNVFEEAERM